MSVVSFEAKLVTLTSLIAAAAVTYTAVVAHRVLAATAFLNAASEFSLLKEV